MTMRGGDGSEFSPRAVYHFPCVDWEALREYADTVKLTPSRKIKYYSVPISFDIEVTSFLDGENKRGTMYAWGVSLDGFVILGRTWDEFLGLYQELINLFDCTDNKRIIIYVHNLAYEFQFLCKLFEWKKVFALDERKPLYALTVDNVEFRCSYQLSGYSLAKVGENLQRYKVQKLKGDLDYDKPRHTKTPLTAQEWQYLINDVQVVVAYIRETIENDGGVHKIPLTKTGYVRNYCRAACFADTCYRKFIAGLTLSVDEYAQLKRAFSGGFTHANMHYVGTEQTHVESYDFNSSYPYAMLSEQYPMSSSRTVHVSNYLELEHYCKNYCCIFDIEFRNISGWDAPDHIISKSKCWNVAGDVVDNGRIVEAETLCTTITNVDFESIKRFYKWESIRIGKCRIYEKAYLPKAFIKAIIKLYKDKTELKGEPGKEVEYMKSKGMVNSAYGMTVTDIVREDNTYLDGWVLNLPDAHDEIERYNKNKNRFLFYTWGVFVTAYARRNLYSGILEFDHDYIYSDTDSVKVKNAKNHQDYIDAYNVHAIEKLHRMCEARGIDYADCAPKTRKGKIKILGLWDDEGEYTRFKTLGAKRYMIEQDGKINITVAGLAKREAVPYIEEQARREGKTPFEFFDEGMVIPEGHAGKLTHSYGDDPFTAILTDYLGQRAEVHEESYIHLGPASYELSMEAAFVNLLKGVVYIE